VNVNVKGLIDAIFVLAKIIILLQLGKMGGSPLTFINSYKSRLTLGGVDAKRGLCSSVDPNEFSSFQCTYMFHGTCASCPIFMLHD